MGKLATRDVGVDALNLPDDHKRGTVNLAFADPLTDARSGHAYLAREFSFAGEVRHVRTAFRQSRESLAVRIGAATIAHDVEFA